MTAGLELNGYHCAWLVPGGAARDVVAADRITRAAGLGALDPAEEQAIFTRFHAEAREHLGRFGLAIADIRDRLVVPA